MNQKCFDLRPNANLDIKITSYVISRSRNEIDINSWEASTTPYISKKNKMGRLEFTSEQEEQCNCAHFSDESKFGYDGRRFVRHSPKGLYSSNCTKSSARLEGGSMMVFDMISVLVRELLPGYPVKLTHIYTK